MKNFLLAIGLVFLVGCGSDNSKEVQLNDDITGAWVGTVTQTNYGQYPMDIQLNTLVTNTISGTVDYPTLNCGGTLTLIETNNNEYTFREKLIEKSSCIDNGIVKIKKFNNGLKWNWAPVENDSYDYNHAYATLVRK